MEEYRDVVGYEGLYKVSNLGNVKSLNYRRTGKEKVLTPSKTSDDYLYVVLSKDKKRKLLRVNRLVYEAFVDIIPDGYDVHHIDEDKHNNTVSNLQCCTHNFNCNTGNRNKKISDALKGRKQTPEHIAKRFGNYKPSTA